MAWDRVLPRAVRRAVLVVDQRPVAGDAASADRCWLQAQVLRDPWMRDPWMRDPQACLAVQGVCRWVVRAWLAASCVPRRLAAVRRCLSRSWSGDDVVDDCPNQLSTQHDTSYIIDTSTKNNN